MDINIRNDHSPHLGRPSGSLQPWPVGRRRNRAGRGAPVGLRRLPGPPGAVGRVHPRNARGVPDLLRRATAAGCRPLTRLIYPRWISSHCIRRTSIARRRGRAYTFSGTRRKWGVSCQGAYSWPAFPRTFKHSADRGAPFPAPRDYNQANGVLRAAKPILRLPHTR